MSKPNRDSYIDFLRSLGLLLIIIAHTYAPETLRSIRTFDVPLMVFISALCYRHNSQAGCGANSYLIKRIKRIYVPVFIFLSIFLSALFVSNYFLGIPEIGVNKVIGSFLLLNSPSIGYVWIMRVFLLMAMITPLLYGLSHRLSFTGTVIVITLLIIAQQALVKFGEIIDFEILSIIFDQFILYMIGYSIYVILGIKINYLSYRQLLRGGRLSRSYSLATFYCVIISGSTPKIINTHLRHFISSMAYSDAFVYG